MRRLHMALGAWSWLALACASAPGIAAQSPLDVGGLPLTAPLRVSARATPDRLSIRIELQPEWHVYAKDVGGGEPVSVRFADGSSFGSGGALRFPPDVDGKLTGDVVVEQPLVRRADGVRLDATLGLMVCDALECLPPMELTIRGDVGPGADDAGGPFRVLLVTDQADDHSARIEAFLRERGFVVTHATYPGVTKEQCDAHAVVLADSKLFGQGEKVRNDVLKFPVIETPIVAVGFHGTQLIEAQKVAMTSGYI